MYQPHSYGAPKDEVKAGRLRYLVMFSDQRYSDPSDVPSASERVFLRRGNFLPLSACMPIRILLKRLRKHFSMLLKRLMMIQNLR